jgi:hypothetical protein
VDQVTGIGGERWGPDVTPPFMIRKFVSKWRLSSWKIVVRFPALARKLRIECTVVHIIYEKLLMSKNFPVGCPKC